MAAIAVFVTPCPIVIARALHDRSFAKNLQEKAPVQGVAAAVGAIAGFVLILGRRSFIDLQTVSIALTTPGLLRFKKIS